ncbi:MAG: YggU family protein [Psychromonas sp.]|nr:YggU family protein [Alteromonadales bacterium]MCP5078396.1 YggU family protein [Psychromonas sp.]
MDKPYLKQDADDLLLRLVLQPKASRDAFVGLLGDELKVAITAPPVDGQANKHLIKFLSKQFKVPKGSIIVEKGQLNRHKLVRVKSPKQIPNEIKG